MMLSYARTFVKSDADAADIVQAAFVKEFHDIDNLEEASQFGGYLRTLVLAWSHGNYGGSQA